MANTGIGADRLMQEPEQVFDRILYVARLRRARRDVPNILTSMIAEELADRLDLVSRSFEHASVIAAEPDHLASRLRATGKIGTVVAIEPPPDEILDLGPGSQNAIFSVLDLQSANDVPGLLIQMRRALKPDGLLLACLFAGDTLTELRQSWLAAESLLTGGVSPRVAPMIGMRELGNLLQRAGLALPVADLDRTIVRYTDAIALIHEIRQLGYSNSLAGRSRTPVSRRLLGAATQHYHQHFADDDGRIRVTLDIAWLTAWSPHDSQPKPLKPGSARMRLAEALKAEEVKIREDRSGEE